MSNDVSESRKFVTLVLRERPDYEGRVRSHWRYFDIDPHHGSVWSMESPEWVAARTALINASERPYFSLARHDIQPRRNPWLA